MSLVKYDTKMLIQKRGYWYYQRRVPKKYAHIDSRRFVKKALGTKSIDDAIAKRDALITADDDYWLALSLEVIEQGGVSDASLEVQKQRYKAAEARALAHGLRYKPMQTLIAEEPPEAILKRVELLLKQSGSRSAPKKEDVLAVLGGVAKPSVGSIKVSKAFELYVAKIAFDDQFNKSPQQRYSWEKTKRTSINYFIDQIGDLSMDSITRDIAVQYRDWWMARMVPDEDGNVRVKPNTANRHIGNMRTLFSAYFKHRGQEDRDNPFRNMYFTAINRSTVKPFANHWVQDKILRPGMFGKLRFELRVIVFTLIETGARLSEIVNLMPEDIHLNAKVPYISIKPRLHRELKTPDSERDIPLVGVALVAMQACPDGFEKYRDKSNLVSANLMKAFKKRNLLPTKDYVINSFRHAFEKRMQEADIDYALRCTLMGHKNTRPAYGDGGSMEYRRDELLKIAHPFEPNLFNY